MKYGVYSINDSLTGFLSPTFELNDAVALRNFEHAVVSSPSLFTSHPEHYTLYRIGSFDSTTGVFVSCTPPEQIVTAQSVVLKFMSNEVSK